MGIRPFIAIQQDLAATAPNVLDSMMKGMLVGPAVQDEDSFGQNVNLSTTYGTISSILSDVATTAKTISVAGLISGANLDFTTLKFGALDAKAKIDFSGKSTYEGLAANNNHEIVLDAAITNVNKSDLLAKGAEKGDVITVSFDDGSGNIITETHKIRDYIEDIGNSTFTIQLWDDIASADLTSASVISIEHYKTFPEARIDTLAPISIEQYLNSGSVFVIDNTSNPVDGGFSATYFVYSPISDPNGTTFSNRIISLDKQVLPTYTEESVTVRVVDGQLLNFFVANRSDLSNNVFEVSTIDYVNKLGAPSLKNKLSYAMQLIERELVGGTMKVYVTEDDTPASYIKALNAIVSQEDAYTVTPLTDSNEVLSAAVSMTKQAAVETVAKYKMSVIGPRTSFYTEKVNASAPTITDLGNGTFKVDVTDVGFLSSNVVGGDFVFNATALDAAEDAYYTQAAETYSNNAIAKVDSVTTDKSLIISPLVSGTDLTTMFPTFKIGAISKNNELITLLKTKAESIDHKNVVSLFPDKFAVDMNGVEVIIPGFYAAAILNSAIAHLPPQQGVSNMSVNSIKKVYGSSFYFSDGELDEIASAGNLVLLQQNYTTAPYVLRQLTTNVSSLETMEINKVRCLDYATFAFAAVLDNYVGKRNITDANVEEIRLKLDNVGKTLISSTENDILGSVITSYEISNVVIPSGESDAVNAYVEVTTPTSMNKIRLFISSGSN